MTTPFDDLIRTVLSDLAEEATPVDLTNRASRQARKRRTVAITISAAALVTGITIGTPLAFAIGRSTTPTAPTSTPSPSFVEVEPTWTPTAVPSPSKPVPSPSGSALSFSGSAPSPSGPVPSLSKPVPSPST